MPMPTVVGVGTTVTSLTTAVPPYPAGYTAVADDIALTFMETESADIPVAPTNWGILAQANCTTGTVTKLTCMWRRLTAAEAAPTIADPGNHITARMIIIRGCATAGNPWELAPFNTEVIADTSVSIGGGTTTGANRLICAAFSTGQDIASTAGATGWADATLANVAEQMDDWSVSGTGGGFAMATGEKAVAGVVGPMIATLALTANFKAFMYIALREAVDTEPKTALIRSARPIEGGATSGPYSMPSQSTILGG